LPLRLALGVVFAIHGGQKLFAFGLAGTAGFLAQVGMPLPTVAAAGVIAVELLGGLALVLGAATRVALLTVHLRGGFFVPDGIEFVLTLLAGALTLAVLGPGVPSVDHARRS
jgi:putative oxidoreductase